LVPKIVAGGADLKYRSGMLRAGFGLPQAIVQTDREKK
jgi:hypothetical protein